MHSAQRYQLPPLTTFSAGARSRSQIYNGLRTGYFFLTITAVLTLGGGPATQIRNNGDLAALFSLVTVTENNDDVVYWDPRMMVALSEAVSPRTMDNARLTSLADGAYSLRTQMMIPFAYPLAVRPWETSFVERNPDAPSYVTLTPWAGFNPANAAGLAPIITTGGTAVLTNLNVNVVQIADKNQVAFPPIFRPRFTMAQQPVTGTVSQLRLDLSTQAPQRGVMFQQDTNVGTVNDIITGYRILTDYLSIDGPNVLSFGDQVRLQTFDYGGNITQYGGLGGAPAGGSYLYRNYQAGGLLSEIVVPEVMGKNLRMEIQGQPSATAGATSSNVNAGIQTLEKVPGVTQAGTGPSQFSY